MKVLSYCLLAFVVCASVFADGPLRWTPQAISSDVDSNGAKVTVQKLTSGKRPRQWELVLQKIKTGDSRWLIVAQKLADGTDAGTSEALQIALATALPKNPSGVLRLAGTHNFLVLEDLCGAPFIEPTSAYLKRYLTEARHALNDLKDARVEQRRTRCLAEIEKAISESSSSH